MKLRNKGLSLRVRRIGRHHVQTVKQENGESAALFTRNEWEHQIRGRQPDLDVASDTALEPSSSKKLRRGFKPIFETRVRRTVYPIQSGDSEIELTIDKGKVEAGRQSSPLCELELELKRGKSAELFKLARMLAEEVPVQLAVKSKAERGYALIAGEVPEAVKAAPVALTPDCSRQVAFQTIGRACRASSSPISQPCSAATRKDCTRCGSLFGACGRQSRCLPTCFLIRRRRR